MLLNVGKPVCEPEICPEEIGVNGFRTAVVMTSSVCYGSALDGTNILEKNLRPCDL